MNCKLYKDMLHSYEKDELDETVKIQISEHLESCEACRIELTEIRKLRQLMGTLKPEGFQLGDMKQSIMSAIQAGKKKLPAYDIKVLAKLGASMVACGIIALTLSFTDLGDGIALYAGQIPQRLEDTESRWNQPMVLINKGLSNMSDTIVNLDGMMFKIQQKIEGGM